jgi:hypothetical protein
VVHQNGNRSRKAQNKGSNYLQRLNSIVVQAIKNEAIVPTVGNTSTQITMPLLTDGGQAETFINQRSKEKNIKIKYLLILFI